MKSRNYIFLVFLLLPVLGLVFYFGFTLGQRNVRAELSNTIQPQPTATQTAELTDPQPPTPVPSPSPTTFPCEVAFTSDREGNDDIFLMAADGSNLRNLTADGAEDWGPAFSPDGKQIAFTSNRSAEGEKYIYVMNADGSSLRQLNQEGESKNPDWSWDGNRIVYSAWGDIFVTAADGSSKSVNLTNSPEAFDDDPAWSPDGSMIAWISWGNHGRDIYVMHADGSHQQQVTNSGEAGDAIWSIDGRIFTMWNWHDREQNCENCLYDPRNDEISDAGGKGEQQRYLPFWTDDGERVELVDIDMFEGNNEIYLVGPQFPDMFLNLTNNPANDNLPSWPDRCGGGIYLEVTPVAQNLSLPQIIHLGYSGDASEKDAFQAARTTDFKIACEELEANCTKGNIPALLDAGVDAIILNTSATPLTELAPQIQTALAQDVPVFLLDAEIDLPGVTSVTIRREEYVDLSFGWMLGMQKDGGQAAYLDLSPVHDDYLKLDAILKDFPEIELVYGSHELIPTQEVPNKVSALLSEYPDLDVLWVNEHRLDVMKVIDQAGLIPGKDIYIFCDPSLEGLEMWQQYLDNHPDADCASVANTPSIAYAAAHAANYLLNGYQLDPTALNGPYHNSLYLDARIIFAHDLQNYLQDMHDRGQNLPDFLNSPEEILDWWFVEQ